jgi:N-acetylmuramoyl-L-alanine amidase
VNICGRRSKGTPGQIKTTGTNGDGEVVLASTDIIRVARQHPGKRYILDNDNADFQDPWDCAEFASWCLYRATEIEIGVRQAVHGLDAYSGYWTDDAHKCGTLIRWQEAAIVPGAPLVRSKGTHPEHPSGPVVICLDENQTIESMALKHAVVWGKTTNRLETGSVGTGC